MADWDRFALGLVGALQAAEDRATKEQQMERQNKLLELQFAKEETDKAQRDRAFGLQEQRLGITRDHYLQQGERDKRRLDLEERRLKGVEDRRAAGGSAPQSFQFTPLDFGGGGGQTAPGPQPYTVAPSVTSEAPVQRPIPVAGDMPPATPAQKVGGLGPNVLAAAGRTASDAPQGLGIPGPGAAVPGVVMDKQAANDDFAVLAGVPPEQVSAAAQTRPGNALVAKYQRLNDWYQQNLEALASSGLPAKDMNLWKRQLDSRRASYKTALDKELSALSADQRAALTGQKAEVKADKDALKAGEDRRKEIMNIVGLAAGGADPNGQSMAADINTMILNLDEDRPFQTMGQISRAALIARDALRSAQVQVAKDTPGLSPEDAGIMAHDRAYQTVRNAIDQDAQKRRNATQEGQARLAVDRTIQQGPGESGDLQDSRFAAAPAQGPEPSRLEQVFGPRRAGGAGLPGAVAAAKNRDSGRASLADVVDASREAARDAPQVSTEAPYKSGLRRAMDRGIGAVGDFFSGKYGRDFAAEARAKTPDPVESEFSPENKARREKAGEDSRVRMQFAELLDNYRKAPPEKKVLLERVLDRAGLPNIQEIENLLR